MNTAVLLLHIFGAIAVGGTVGAALVALIQKKDAATLLLYAKHLGLLTMLQYVTGILLIAVYPAQFVRGCVALLTYTTVVAVIEALLITAAGKEKKIALRPHSKE